MRDTSLPSINATGVAGQTIVLNCPIKSVPQANVAWYFNKTLIAFDTTGSNKDSRRVKVLLDWKFSCTEKLAIAHNGMLLHLLMTFPLQLCRFFMLTNGSLLLVNAKETDSGKYKCNATNLYTQKVSRSSGLSLNIVPVTNETDLGYLLPFLQNQTQQIKSGSTLILHCASNANSKVRFQANPKKLA